MLDILLYSVRTGLRQWRIAFTVYIIQLCLAFTVGMQVYEVLEASIGRSLELNKLLQHYDHTVITDFLSIHGASLTPLIGQLRWLLPVWLLFSVFINGGMLYCAAFPEQASWRAFWQGGAAYFFPFLKIALFFLVLALLWSVLVLLPAAASLMPALEGLPSEQYAVWGVAVAALVWLSGLALIYIWSVLSRLQCLQLDTTLSKGIKDGVRLLWKRKMRLLGILAVFVGTQLLLAGGYWWLEASGGMTAALSVVLFFGVQQAAAFSRVVIRQMCYVGLSVIR